MASFTTAVRQMIEMTQWPKCLSKILTEMSQQNKQRQTHTVKHPFAW